MASSRAQAHKGRVRLRLTWPGWLFFLVVCIVATAAAKSQSAMLFLIVGAMVGVVAVSGLMPKVQLRGVHLEREVPLHVWQNQIVHLGYYLRNLRKRSCLAVTLEELPAKGIERAGGFCAHLPAGGTFRSGARFVVHRRGRVDLTGVRLVSSFPFGLIVGRRTLDRKASLVIWPARGALKKRLLHQGAVEVSSGPPTQATGGQDEFFGLRDYRCDDNPRWIHWRRSANRPVPVVREMCRPKPEVLWVIVDTRLEDRSRDAWLRRERSIRFAGTLIEHALSRGYRVGLALAFDGQVWSHPAAAGRGQMHLLLTALADVDDTTAIPLERLVGRLRRHHLEEAEAVLVTAGHEGDDRARRGLRAMCRNLTVLTHAHLPAVYEDDPLVAAEEAG